MLYPWSTSAFVYICTISISFSYSLWYSSKGFCIHISHVLRHQIYKSEEKTIHYYKRRGWLQDGVSDTRFSVSCRGKKFRYCISKVQLLMSYTRFNTMKFSRLRNWIGYNTISIYVSAHVQKTVHNFISTPLVQEGSDKWTEKDRGSQTAYDFKICFCSLTTLREQTS